MLTRRTALFWLASSPFLSACSSVANTQTPTLHLLGDSTMAPYPDRRPQAGWGETLPQFFNAGIRVKNWAKGGRSSRSFYYEADLWPNIRPQINAGDYVLLQFGHNDERLGAEYAKFATYAWCPDGSQNAQACIGGKDPFDPDADRAEHSFWQILRRYIQEIRARGATPILATPIVRKYFENGRINREGLHDVGKKTGETLPRGDYSAAMRDLAKYENVPLLDLTERTRQLVEQYGDAAATAELYIPADKTHPREKMAQLISELAVAEFKRLKLLNQYLRP